MSDNIWGNRFAERRDHGVAWHRLGHALPEDGSMTVESALPVYGLNYRVETVPLKYVSPTSGTLVDSSQVAIVRPAFADVPEAVYGYASSQFRPLQNEELARMIAPLEKEWPLETIGAIRRGADIFVTLHAGTSEIGGDQIEQYFFVWNSHDGTSALKVRVTPIRVVCQNTCIMGDQSATIAVDVRHTQRILTDAGYAFDLVARLRKSQDQVLAKLGELTTIRLSAEDITRVLEAAYPIKEYNSKLAFYDAHSDGLSDEEKGKLEALRAQALGDRARALKLRVAVFDRYIAFNEENPMTAKTGWALYNAVTETECWKEGGTDQEAARSVLAGPRGQTMARAYNALVGVN